MDIQTFIQSGILECYAVGSCSAAEREEVERIAALHPTVRAELNDIELTLERYAVWSGIQPPAGLKAKILGEVQKNDQSAELPELTYRNTRWPYLAGAAVLVGLGVWTAQLATQNNTLRQQQTALQQQVDDCTENTRRLELLQQQNTLMRDPATAPIALQDAAKGLESRVYYNPKTRSIVLDRSALAPPPSGKYYQFWAIVDGKPVSMGMVQSDSAADWQRFDFVDNAQAFAISEEDNPNGNATPTTVLMIQEI
jgi:Anti-sigma-K factor rskA